MSEVGTHLIIQPVRQAVWFHPAWMQRKTGQASAHVTAAWILMCFPSQRPGIDLPLSSPSKLSPAVSDPRGSWSSQVNRTAHIHFLLWVWKDSQQGPCHGSMSGYPFLPAKKEHVLWEFPGWTASCLSWCNLVPVDGKEPLSSPSVMAVCFLPASSLAAEWTFPQGYRLTQKPSASETRESRGCVAGR